MTSHETSQDGKMSLPSQPQAYGSGMAGGSFDPVAFIKRPQVILRIVSWVGIGLFRLFFNLNTHNS